MSIDIVQRERQRKRIDNPPSHGTTNVSKANLQIEADLQASLTKVTNLIKKEVIKRSGDTTNAKTNVFAPSWSDLFFRVKPVLQVKTYDLIREAATNSYQLGITYAAKQLKKPVYFTSTDIDIIKELTARYNDQFWRRIQLIVYTAGSTLNNGGIEYPDALMRFIAVNLCSEALAKSTIQKTRALT